MLEVEVHQHLRAFLRDQGGQPWPHHLTLARLVARALRLGRSSLIQLGTVGGNSSYRVSYLMAALLWPKGAVVVAPEATLQQIMATDLPPLQQWLPHQKPVHRGDRWPDPQFTGLLLTTPAAWLAPPDPGNPAFPPQIPTFIEGADDLEQWFIDYHTLGLQPQDWLLLTLAYPQWADRVRDVQVRLTHTLFHRPPNLYGCCLLDAYERVVLQELLGHLQLSSPTLTLPEPWHRFQTALSQGQGMALAHLDRAQGSFRLEWSPLNIADSLGDRWNQQPVVLLRETVANVTQTAISKGRLGLNDVTIVKFGLDRHTEQVRLYLPDHLPLPNTSYFYPALLVELRRLLTLSATSPGFAVVLINDRPLQSQVGATLAAEFGSRVQIERLNHPNPPGSDPNPGILVSGWDFWRQHQQQLPNPQLLVMATLPLPSLEDPRVAGRVAYHKQRGQDWFHCYLLPHALVEIQRAIAPVRRSQGVLALLDLRVLHRSYGQQILTTLSPMARLGYLDPSLFTPQNCLV
ncbi:helicase C-terminal domain-containing protein [Prochlorothrix hollandica]|uniref:ATP-dependent helicase C-terminal domain-containing protein n=1 Tax=Prochlorothrix hollandica PCC 9006 = CALU 1027 TaxID=317619 RepID=A0A0M2PUP5_PROHO|nr:helicase C-terminal domain-containing protein [Prochlorothrix hollandica]KKI98378.1 hypothetical protein PROH_19200 [Prochlorothrix hollandica PCC 9006 = CALU 1027]